MYRGRYEAVVESANRYEVLERALWRNGGGNVNRLMGRLNGGCDGNRVRND